MDRLLVSFSAPSFLCQAGPVLVEQPPLPVLRPCHCCWVFSRCSWHLCWWLPSFSYFRGHSLWCQLPWGQRVVFHPCKRQPTSALFHKQRWAPRCSGSFPISRWLLKGLCADDNIVAPTRVQVLLHRRYLILRGQTAFFLPVTLPQACHKGNDQRKHLQTLISTPFLTPNIPPFLSVFSQYILGSCCVTRPGVACPIIHTPKQEGRVCVLMENWAHLKWRSIHVHLVWGSHVEFISKNSAHVGNRFWWLTGRY